MPLLEHVVVAVLGIVVLIGAVSNLVGVVLAVVVVALK
jgi:hypothetical protein